MGNLDVKTVKWFLQEQKFTCKIQDRAEEFWFLQTSIQNKPGQTASLFYKVKESIFCDFTAGIYQLHIKCNTHSHYFILIFTHELTCCWQSSFRNSLIKWCTLINSSSSTLWYFKRTLDKLSSGIRNDLQDLTWISEKNQCQLQIGTWKLYQIRPTVCSVFDSTQQYVPRKGRAHWATSLVQPPEDWWLSGLPEPLSSIFMCTCPNRFPFHKSALSFCKLL